MNDLITANTQTQLITTDSGRPDENPATVYLMSLSKSSRRTMRGALNSIARIVVGDDEADHYDVPWEQLRFQHTAAIRSQLAENYKYTTANRMLSAMRGVLKAAWQLGLMSAEEYQLAASVEAISGSSMPAGRHIPSGEVLAMLSTCTQDRLGIRDAAILSFLYGLGLRREEAAGLDLADYDASDESLIIRGKGNKERMVPVAGGAADALRDWLVVRGRDAGPLFRGVGNRNRGGRLTSQAIYKMIKQRAKMAHINTLSPHDFRRTFVGELLDAGADISTVQKLAGHADPSTTARYDRRGEKAKRKAVELLHVPYSRRTLESE